MSTRHNPVSDIREGVKVCATVTKLVSSGVIVRLEQGQEGIIRRSEFSWERSPRRTEQVFSVGERVEAVVLRIGEKGFLELSIKHAQGDPWEKVKRGEYHKGDVITGEVVNLERYGAFVELEPGIVGLLHQSHIPEGEYKEIQDLLWIGDQVKASIVEINAHRRRIRLSITDLLDKRYRRHQETSRIGGAVERDIGGQGITDHMRLSQELRQTLGQRVRRILIVDDDTEFVDGFVDWLRRLGYETSTIETGQETIPSALTPDLVFLDVDLLEANGLTSKDEILDRNPDAEIVLTADPSWFGQNEEFPEGLRAAAMLLKPLDYGEVLELLALVEKGSLIQISPKETTINRRDIEFLERVSKSLKDHHGLRKVLTNVLDDLLQETEAGRAVIFGVDQFTERVSILADSGHKGADVSEADLQSLRFSPVKSVALDKQHIMENDATAPGNKKFDKLLMIFRFDSCIALPISVGGHDIGYALFLFDPISDKPMSMHYAKVFSVSYFAATAIREDYVRTLLVKAQRLLLTGQLAANLLHEIRNKVNAIEQQARNLELDCLDLSEVSETTSLLTWSEQFSQRTQGILSSNAELRSLVLEYLGLMRQEELAEVDINELICQTVRQVASLARENQVKVMLQLDPQMPCTLTIPLRLEQAFLNVGLNAIQQVGEYSLQGNRLEIASSYTPDEQYPIAIRFTDEGLGIHRKLWGWIFEMGTSTRRGGTGFGLFGSRGLLESLGGRISVENSHMFIGSTFLIELPFVAAEEDTYG